jgi:hypothetical protein
VKLDPASLGGVASKGGDPIASDGVAGGFGEAAETGEAGKAVGVTLSTGVGAKDLGAGGLDFSGEAEGTWAAISMTGVTSSSARPTTRSTKPV